MPSQQRGIIQFWQELKRRKVIKVIAMYAGVAYIIIELVSNITEPLHLPPWTTTLVILLLAIGFPITAILSWIFDVTPEGLKKTEPIKVAKEKETSAKPARRKLRVSDIFIAVLIVAVVILLYPKIFNKDKFQDIRDADGRISIAVMPFENLTGDSTLNWFQRGISSLIINGLGNSSELSVRDDQTMYEVMESMNQVFTTGVSPSQAKEVAKKVRAETYLSGSYQGREGKYWILVNLVDTESGDITWANKVEGDLNSSEYLNLVDSLCNEIKNYLEIQALEQEADYDFREAYTESAEAYRYFIEGMNLILTCDFEAAIESLKKALEIDSTFTFASFYIAYAYDNNNQFGQARIWTQKTYNTKDRMPIKYQYLMEIWYAAYVSQNQQDIIRYCNLFEESGIESRLMWFDLALSYYILLRQYDKVIEAFEEIEEISLERDSDWEFEPFYGWYGQALHKVGKHEKEKEIYEIGLRIHPKSGWIIWNQAVCVLSHGDTTKANEYLEKAILFYRELNYPEALIEHLVDDAYNEVNNIDNAMLHYQKAF